MMKVEFLKRWAKKASGGGAVEAFEVDVEKLMRSTVRMSSSAVVNGLLKGLDRVDQKDRELFRKLIAEVSPAVERALAKLY
jgi:hypothetical protein